MSIHTANLLLVFWESRRFHKKTKQRKDKEVDYLVALYSLLYVLFVLEICCEI